MACCPTVDQLYSSHLSNNVTDSRATDSSEGEQDPCPQQTYGKVPAPTVISSIRALQSAHSSNTYASIMLECDALRPRVYILEQRASDSAVCYIVR